MKKLTDQSFWENFYKNGKTRRISKKGFHILDSHLKNIFSKFFDIGDKTLVEFGCGGSLWLPYFAKLFKFKVNGIDFSPKGVTLSQQNLILNNIGGVIYEYDFFKLPDKFRNKYDIGLSFGVIEHFTEPSEVLQIFSETLKKGGILVTGVPKLTGFQGFLQKHANIEILNKHIVISMDKYVEEHRKAGLEIIEKYEIGLAGMGLNFGDRKYLAKLYRVFNKLINLIFKIFLNYNFVNKYNIGSYYILISKKLV